MKRRCRIKSEDGWVDWELPMSQPTVVEEEFYPESTGLLDSRGNRIIRVPAPKPQIGFTTPAEEFDIVYGEDWYYDTEPDFEE